MVFDSILAEEKRLEEDEIEKRSQWVALLLLKKERALKE